ncbi:MAG: hypothetical protein CML66_11085 [Rhodobacteraceae bacterium]|nr:hypothetical protein [Paracoccaceae bacterium]MAY46983.1 hypothetical protein [Paracoccaceae bacterium]QEW18717.1 LamB/YcsF family protein [Marinibacterium anthonyi]
MFIDLNSDMGEGFGPWQMGDDAAMLDIVTTANIACGLHAGDPMIMRRTVEMAHARGVAVGAHPGYADLAGFGRRALPGVTASEIETLVAYQAGALAGICASVGVPMAHVKTHGALGNACADDDALADAVARGIRAVDPALAFIVLPGTATERAADRHGLRAIPEIYADRTYGEGFNLAPRSTPGSVITDPAEAAARALRMLGDGRIETLGGKTLKTPIQSICLHSDTPGAIAMARHLRHALEAGGWTCAGWAGR